MLLQSNKCKSALKISFEYWALGLLLFVLISSFGVDFSETNFSEMIKIALVINPFVVLFFSSKYFKEINSKNISDGFYFGLFLLATQLFADALFVLLFLKNELPSFNIYRVALLYGEMAIFSIIQRYLYKSY